MKRVAPLHWGPRAPTPPLRRMRCRNCGGHSCVYDAFEALPSSQPPEANFDVKNLRKGVIPSVNARLPLRSQTSNMSGVNFASTPYIDPEPGALVQRFSWEIENGPRTEPDSEEFKQLRTSLAHKQEKERKAKLSQDERHRIEEHFNATRFVGGVFVLAGRL